jgi:hypothetical protein
MTALAFLSGVFVGGFLGVFAMALFVGARKGEE